MRPFLRITLTGLATGTLIAALVAAAMPVWLLVRIPGAVTSPKAEAS
jgi:hypothetical protein